MRLPLIDGLRGYFLLMMMVAHLALVDPFLSLFSHHKFGYVEDAQGFVFLSGFVIALVYGRMLQKTSFRHMQVKLYARVRQLYIYNFASLAVVFALSYSTFQFAPEVRHMANLGGNVWQDVVLSLLVIDGPLYVDILPMYICFMLLTPFVLRMLWNDGFLTVIAISVGVWVIAQSGIFNWFANYITAFLDLQVEEGLDMSLYFFRWSWQILFMGGLVAGALYARGKLDLSRLHERRFEQLFHLSLIGVFFFLLLKISLMDRLAWLDPDAALLHTSLSRSNFGLLRLANFVVDTYAFVYLAVVGPTSRNGLIRALGKVINAVFSWTPFRVLGQNSLQAYALHVVLVYLVAAAVFQFGIPVGSGVGDAILIGCWAILFGLSFAKARGRAR
jgi:hypothetical protein|tara:strand:+ start:2969 stop:4132 length:1164 start_codon:yes stop_codon:yes gene_type:complete